MLRMSVVGAGLVFVSMSAASTSVVLVNGGFEDPDIHGAVLPFATFSADIKAYHDADVPGWETNDVEDVIELWHDGAADIDASQNGYTFSSYEGDQFAEINAYSNGTLSGMVTPSFGSIIGFNFAHRGRLSDTVSDVISVKVTDLGLNGVLGGGDDLPLVNQQQYSATRAAWQVHFEPLGISTGNSLLLEFTAVSSAGGNPLFGNFVDAIEFGEDVVPEPGTLSLLLLGGMAILRRRLR